MIIAIEYYWKDTPETTEVGYIKVGSFNPDTATTEEKKEDELIFYYVDDVKDIESLKDANGVEDFVVTKYEKIN